FPCARKYIPYGTESDVTGIYGQNGSGKSALITAIGILKCLVSGDSLRESICDCIRIGADYARLTFTFEYQYPNDDGFEEKYGFPLPEKGDVRKLVYSFKLGRAPKQGSDFDKAKFAPMGDREDHSRDSRIKYDSIPYIFDEVFSAGGTFFQEQRRLKPFLDTSVDSLGPKSKVKDLFGTLDEKKRIEIEVQKKRSKEKATSFAFSPSMMQFYLESSKANSSLYAMMMVALWIYCSRYLMGGDSLALIAGTSYSDGEVMIRFGDHGFLFLNICGFSNIPAADYEIAREGCNSLGKVIDKIVPGLSLDLRDCGKTMNEEGEEQCRVELLAVRDGMVFPLRFESAGVIKLIMILEMLICAFNDPSVTVVIDEFDTGVFEYLLGEIILTLKQSGKGQFIFTSHNLRPLEVLNKDCVWFTTTDPKNRFAKISYVGETNNLRRVYFREIALHEHYNNLYQETKRNRIISAMRKAGGNL
ncbi:MAG: ATP-binding protein, partial [Clostridia bacterium]|nr:ATP-binding protein [Clostridia bacterium]